MNSISNLKSNNQEDISGSRNKAKHSKMWSKLFSIFEIKSLAGASVVGLIVFVVNQARVQNTSINEATTQLRHTLLSLDTFHTLFCTIAGVLGFYLLFKIFKTLFFNKVRFDRVLAEMRSRVLCLTFVFILCFPCSIAILINLFSWAEPYDLLYDEQQYVSRPQVHETNIQLDTLFANGIDPLNNQISLKLSLNTKESKDSIQQILENNAEDPSIFWTTFYHFHDPGNQHMTGTPRGRFIAWIIGILGSILLTGILISSIVNYIERRIDRWKQGLIHYKFNKDEYVVIIGGHDSVPRIIKQVLNKYTTLKYIIVVTEHDIPTYRQHLSSYLTESEINKLVLYRGERDSKNDIEGVNVHYSSLKAVYIIGEQGSDGFMEPSNDARNLECLNLIYEGRKEKVDKSAKPLPCFVMFEHQTTYSAFVYSDSSKDFKELISLTPFSFYELWAQKVLSSCPLSKNNEYWPIDQEFDLDEKKNPTNVKGIDRYSDKRVHFIIIGMSRMGAELAKEVATICHYPNFVQQEIEEEIQLISVNDAVGKISSKKGELRTKITIIDPDIDTQMNLFINRSRDLFELSKWTYVDTYTGKKQVDDNLNKLGSFGFSYSHLREDHLADANFIDTEWEFIKGRAEEDYVANYLRKSVNSKELVTVAVCIPKDELSASIAANLPGEVHEKALQVLVYQRNSRQLIDQLSGKSTGIEPSLRYYRIKPFGMLSDCFDHQILDYTMAKIIHYSKFKDNLPKGDMKWQGKTLLEKWSSIYSSHAWSVAFRSLNFNFTQANKEKFVDIFKNSEIKSIYGRVEHNRWVMERLLLIKQRPLTNDEWDTFVKTVKVNSLKYPLLLDSYFDPFRYDEPSGLDDSYSKLFGNIKNEKDAKKKNIMNPHLDICSYWMLRNRDLGSLQYDVDRYERIERSYDDFFKEDLI